MAGEKKQAPRRRRRVRWGRLAVFLLCLSGVLYAAAWCVGGIYSAGRSVYQECSALVEEFESGRSLPEKFRDARFAPFTNILLLGIDDGDAGGELSGRRSDAVVVISINQETGFVHLLSVPRDTKVKIPGRTAEDKISQAYYYGGTQLSVRAVEELLQIPLHHFIVIDMEAFTELVDVLGGIYLYVEQDMDYEDPYAQLAIHLKKGYQYLNGAEALQYMRYRSDELGDIGRVQRQQKFLKKLYGEILKVDTIAKLPEIMDIINRRVTTSMAVLDTAHTAKALSDMQADFIAAEMLPGKTVQENDAPYYQVDPARVKALVDEIFKAETPPEQAAEK